MSARFLPKLVASFTLAALGLAPTLALADQKAECIDASERAQRSRIEGKLPEARKDLLACARSECPAVIRQDCSQWLQEVTQLMPTLVIVAKDGKGADLTDVRVFLDDQEVASRLDGKGLPVSTGNHVLRMEHGTDKPVEMKVLVREGEKARSIEVRFGEVPKTVDAGAGGPIVPAGPPRKTNIAPLIVIGVGAAAAITGGVVALTGYGGIPDECSSSSKTCKPGTSDTTKDKAASAHGQGLTGLAIVGAGGAVALGGLLWYVIAPTTQDKTVGRLQVTPTVTAGGAAVHAAFTF